MKKDNLSVRDIKRIVYILIAICFYILSISLVYGYLLVPGALSAFSDLTIILDTSISSVFNLNVWRSSVGTGQPVYETPRILINAISNLVTLKNGYAHWNQYTIKILFIYPYILFSSSGIYFIVKHLFKQKLDTYLIFMISSILSVLYSVNSSVLAILYMGHLHLIIPYALYPWAVLYTVKILEEEQENSLLSFWILTLIVVVMSVFDFRMYYIFALIQVIFILVTFCTDAKGERKHSGALLKVILPHVFVFSVNFYWIFLLILSHDSNYILNRPIFGSQFTSIICALFFHHPYSTGSSISIFQRNDPQIFDFVSSFLVFISIYIFIRKERLIKFIALIYILLLILIKQESPPFINFYSWLFNHFPGFSVFRESMKLLLLQNIVFIVASIFLLYSSRNRTLVFNLVVVLLFVQAIYRVLSFSSLKGPFSAQSVVNSYSKVTDEVSGSSSFYRTLWIPRGSNYTHYSDRNPAIAYSWYKDIWCHYMEDTGVSPEDPCINRELLDYLGVRYVILLEKYNALDGTLYDDPTEYHKNLEFLKNMPNLLSRNDLDLGTAKVFERTHFLGKVFSVTDSYGTTATKELTYSVISPSTYKIFIPKYSGTFSFVLSESFSDKWYISREGPNKFGIFPLFKYVSGNPVDYVTKDFRGLNLTEFVFSDASYSGQTIYVYYRDQEYLKIGLILSLILTSLSFTIAPVILRKANFVGKDISK